MYNRIKGYNALVIAFYQSGRALYDITSLPYDSVRFNLAAHNNFMR